jgi:hypothetical protein
MVELTWLQIAVFGGLACFVSFLFGWLMACLMAAASRTDDQLGIRG